MIYGIFARLARVRFTVGYMAILVAVSTVILMVDPQTHDRIIQRASTNLHNLSHGHLSTLLNSALVVEAGPLYFWMPFLACLLALAELHLHTIRLMVAFVVGHIGATLVVVAALAACGRARLDAVVDHPHQRCRNELWRPGGARGADCNDSAGLACRLGWAGGFRRA